MQVKLFHKQPINPEWIEHNLWNQISKHDSTARDLIDWAYLRPEQDYNATAFVSDLIHITSTAKQACSAVYD